MLTGNDISGLMLIVGSIVISCAVLMLIVLFGLLLFMKCKEYWHVIRAYEKQREKIMDSLMSREPEETEKTYWWLTNKVPAIIWRREIK